MTTREKWIDNAKGIAILLIIIGHIGGGLKEPVQVLFVFGVHLVVFFLLSGYTMKKREGIADFVNSRFRRLMIPYFCTCGAVLLMDLWNRYYWDGDLSVNSVTFWIRQDLIRSFFASGTFTRFTDVEIGTRIGAVWFLPAMFFASVLCQVLLHITRNIWQFGFAAAAFASLAMVSRHFIWLPFSIQSGMLASLFLWFGYYIREKKLLDKVRWYHYAAAQGILIWGIYQGYCGTDFVTAFLNDVSLSPIVGVSACLLIYGISRLIPDGFLAYLGRISLTILCVHLFAMETLEGYVNVFLDRFALTGDPRGWLKVLVEIIIAVTGAIVLEKMKAWFSAFRKMHDSAQAERKQPVPERIAEGIFLLLFLLGQKPEDNHLLPLIKSVVPAAFLFFTGYWSFRPASVISAGIHFAVRYFVPCGVCFLGRLLYPELLTGGTLRLIVYMLVSEMIWLLLERMIKPEGYLCFCMFALSVLGMSLRKNGFVLPMDMDVALYLLVYILAGWLCRKYALLSYAADRPWIYFVISPVWVYMIYRGDADIMLGNYGRYGSVIGGALAGITVLYMLAAFLSRGNTLPGSILEMFGCIPVTYAAAAVCLLHQVGAEKLAGRINPGNAAGMVLNALLELAAAGLLFVAVWFIVEKGILRYGKEME